MAKGLVSGELILYSLNIIFMIYTYLLHFTHKKTFYSYLNLSTSNKAT